MDHCCSDKRHELETLARDRAQRRVLIAVMAINFGMFLIEFVAGLIAQSSALQADAVDMLGDGIVYALSLWAIGRGARWDAGAALTKAALILAFFAFIAVGMVEKVRHGVPPSSGLMLVIGAVALVANLSCLALLWRFRKLNLNMRSTFECSRNVHPGAATADEVVIVDQALASFCEDCDPSHNSHCRIFTIHLPIPTSAEEKT
jgi:Co/Zn/Cd efflux system component